MNPIIEYGYGWLRLTKPYLIQIQNKDCKAGVAAYYLTRKHWHKIVVYMPALARSNYELNSVILHEFCHAWQDENGHGKKEYHGKDFQFIAKGLEKAVNRRFKMKLQHLYSPKTDTD